MKRIKSFEIDHATLTKGLYVSRTDRVGLLAHVTTFDVRMKTPYKEPHVCPEAAHVIEHALATFLRNTRRDVAYVGPMGCLTGFYVILNGRKRVADLLPSLISAFEWILTIDAVPGASEKECGNYQFMNLAEAKRESKQYLLTLKSL